MIESNLRSPLAQGCKVHRFRFLLSSLALIGLSAATVSVTLALMKKPDAHGLVIEPQDSKITDRTFEDGDIASSRFRILNPMNRPVMIKAIRTSCSCMAMLPESGMRPPFTIEPGDSTEVLLQVSVRAEAGPLQTYFAQIESECDNRPLPNRFASISFPVRDALKAYPPTLAVVNAPFDQPITRKILLYSYRGDRGWGELELRVSDSRAIRAILSNELDGQDSISTNYQIQYIIDTTIIPYEGSQVVSGNIDVIHEGRKMVSIPVSCAFEQEYRLSRESIEAEGTRHDIITKELFFESDRPEWNELEVVSCPDNIDVLIQRYDESTQRIYLKIRIPEDLPAESDMLVLARKDGEGRVSIPINYAIIEE